MSELLRHYGATDDLPRMDCISVRRPSANYFGQVFTKGTNDWNQFTLLDLIGVQCDFLAFSPYGGGNDVGGYSQSSFFNKYHSLPFPDLARLRIRRPAADLKGWQEQTVDLRPLLESGDCSKDVPLEWGNVVDIPEADHMLNAAWPGFSKTQLANLKKCLTRQVEIVINGQATKITLAPQIFNVTEGERPANLLIVGGSPIDNISSSAFNGRQPYIHAHMPFWLKPVLLQSKLLLTSSDLRHVKVTHRDPTTGQTREWVVDCAEASPAPDFWLRDGDKIEVPALASEPSATATAGVVSVAPQIPDLGAGWGERKLVFAIDPIEQPAEFVNGFASQNPTNREAMVQTVRKTLATNGSVGMAEFWYTRSEGHLELVISRYPDQHLLDKHWNELTPKFDPKAVAPRVGDSAAWLSTPGRQFVFVFRQGLYTGWVECKTELSGQLRQPLMQLAKVAAAKMAQTAESGASPNAAPPHR